MINKVIIPDGVEAFDAVSRFIPNSLTFSCHVGDTVYLKHKIPYELAMNIESVTADCSCVSYDTQLDKDSDGNPVVEMVFKFKDPSVMDKNKEYNTRVQYFIVNFKDGKEPLIPVGDSLLMTVNPEKNRKIIRADMFISMAEKK